MALLCTYTYDPLDRVSTLTPLAQAVSSRFYNGGQLMTELQGGRQRTCVRAGGQLLAQQSREGDAVMTTMLAGDRQNSVLHASGATQQADIAYTPYGHRDAVRPVAELPGFNGEQPDPVTGHYLLGNGYRAYNPMLMRFNSPDSLSPFGKGGLNAYAYCVGDPVNRVDPTGHISIGLTFLSGILFSAVGAGAIGASVGLKGSDSELSTILGVVGSLSLLIGASGFANTVHKWRGANFPIKDLKRVHQKELEEVTERARSTSQLLREARGREFLRMMPETSGTRRFIDQMTSADALVIDGNTFYSDNRLSSFQQAYLDSQFTAAGRKFTAVRADRQGRLQVKNIRSGRALSQNNYEIRGLRSDPEGSPA